MSFIANVDTYEEFVFVTEATAERQWQNKKTHYKKNKE